MHGHPYSFSHSVEQALALLREQLLAEGSHTVAAIVLEGVTGSNGTLRHPPGFLEGVRALCDAHGIMMVSDEVMSGWGRTGKLFGFQHSAGVIPDIVTSAKGFNSAVLPLGLVGLRAHVAERLRTTASGIGSTYSGHPVALASAYAALKHFLREDIVGKVRAVEPVINECMQQLAGVHPAVKQARTVGCLGSIDVQRTRAGDFISEQWEPAHPAMQAFRADLLRRGCYTLVKGHTIFSAPPLVSTPDEVRAMFKLVGESLPILDAIVEDGRQDPDDR